MLDEVSEDGLDLRQVVLIERPAGIEPLARREEILQVGDGLIPPMQTGRSGRLAVNASSTSRRTCGEAFAASVSNSSSAPLSLIAAVMAAG